MPTRRNPNYRGYNDPAIAQGFANIADIFKPPSGTDAYGFAKARETQEKLQRAADLYRYITDPNFDQSQFDRMGVASGVWQPNQSYYSVDQTNQTSQKNNAADNTRALEQTRMQQSGETTRAMLQPVGQGATRFVPPSVASLYGVPETQVGVVNAGRGDTVVTPDNRKIMGAPVPLSETEMKAAIIAKMPQAQQTAIAFGNTPVENVRTATGAVVPMTRPEQLSQNLPSVPSGQTQLANYKLPDGRNGTAAYDPIQGGWVDSQTRLPLPEGATTYTAQLSGDKTGTGLGPTVANRTTGNNQMAEIQRARDTLSLYEALLTNNPGAIGVPGLIRGTAQNAIATVDDLAKAFGRQAPQINAAVGTIRQGLQGVAPEYFDPSIPEADFYQGTLAYALARTENPSGEVSRQAFERALERVKGGSLANSQSALAAVGAMRKQLDIQERAANALLGNNGGSANAPAQPGQPTQTSDLPTVSTPEEANALPSGTRFRDPQGNIRVRP